MSWRRLGRRWAQVAGLTACLLFLPFVPGAAAQETLLERWTLGYLSESWSPRWDALTPAGWPDSGAVPRVRVSVGAELVSFRESLRRDQSTVSFGVRVPLNSSVGLRASATSGAWLTEAGGRPVMETPRSQAAAAGADLDISLPALGRLRIEALGGWDLGPGGFARVETSSSYHEVTVSGWRTHARESRLLFPADSLRDLGMSHVTTGGEVVGAIAVPLAGATLRPSVRWRRETFQAPGEAAKGFLTTSPSGSHTLLATELEADVGVWQVKARYRSRGVSFDSRIMRLDASAGQLPVALLDLWGWSAAVSHPSGDRRWTIEGGSDQFSGELSARVETWPFASFWESLSAQAYRLNGDMAARSQWICVRNTLKEGAGWSWSVEVGRYALRLDRDSWYVTSFGFGRRDREITASGVDSAVLVGGGVTRRLMGGFGALVLRVQAGVPVSARALDGAQGSTGGGAAGDGLAGYLRVVLDWAW